MENLQIICFKAVHLNEKLSKVKFIHIKRISVMFKKKYYIQIYKWVRSEFRIKYWIIMKHFILRVFSSTIYV